MTKIKDDKVHLISRAFSQAEKLTNKNGFPNSWIELFIVTEQEESLS